MSTKCPFCEYQLRDFWDYPWDGSETIRIECPSCDKDIVVTMVVDVIYEVDIDKQAELYLKGLRERQEQELIEEPSKNKTGMCACPASNWPSNAIGRTCAACVTIIKAAQ